MPDAAYSIALICGLLVFSQLSPGPDVFLVFRTALARGARGGIAVGCGISLGFLIQAAVACYAGAWVMQQSWSLYMLWAAAVWLLYLAWKIFPKKWQGDEPNFVQQQTLLPYLSLLLQGFLCNILNPKCMLFILTLSAGSLQQYAGCVWYAPLLMLALTLSGMLGWCMWSALLQWPPLRDCYVRNTKTIDALFALLLALFAILLLLP